VVKRMRTTAGVCKKYKKNAIKKTTEETAV